MQEGGLGILAGMSRRVCFFYVIWSVSYSLSSACFCDSSIFSFRIFGGRDGIWTWEDSSCVVLNKNYKISIKCS